MSKPIVAFTVNLSLLATALPLWAATDHCLESPYHAPTVTNVSARTGLTPAQDRIATTVADKRRDCESGQSDKQTGCGKQGSLR